MSDSAVSKASDVLQQLSADPDVRALAEAHELAQATRRIEHAGLLEQGRQEGKVSGQRRAVARLCAIIGIPFDAPRIADVATTAERPP